MAFEQEIPDLNSGLFPHRTLSLICNIMKSFSSFQRRAYLLSLSLGKAKNQKGPPGHRAGKTPRTQIQFSDKYEAHFNTPQLFWHITRHLGTDGAEDSPTLPPWMHVHALTYSHIYSHTQKGTCDIEQPEERKLPVKLIARLQNSLEPFEIIG